LRRVVTKDDIATLQITASLTSRARIVEHTTDSLLGLTQPPVVPTEPDDYLSQVVKYIPAEIVTAYVAIDGILRSAVGISTYTGWIVFAALLILTPIYTWYFTKLKDWPPPYAQVTISTTAFVIWVLALGGPFKELTWYNSAYGSIGLILFTLVAPILGAKKRHKS
jgi:hypothetical protein